MNAIAFYGGFTLVVGVQSLSLWEDFVDLTGRESLGDVSIMIIQDINNQKWVRSSEGWVAGVCQGLGERFGLAPGVLRLLWLISIFFFGFGLWIYVGLALSLPRVGKVYESTHRVLGVCYKLSLKTGLEVGLLRFIALFLLVTSAILPALIGYILLYFFAFRD